MIAVANGRVSENRAMACGAGTGCPACFMEPDPFLLAVCEAGTCEALNLRTDALTLCESDAECQLAARTCCACGALAARDVIAFNPERGSYAEWSATPARTARPASRSSTAWQRAA